MTNAWLEAKYVNLVSHQLRNFKQRGSFNWNFSCPICGDSSNKRKARGYVYPSDKGILLYYCHNEGKTYTIDNFLKTIDNHLYSEFIKEKLESTYKERQEHEEFVHKLTRPKFHSDTVLRDLKKVSQLPADHPAKLYVENRQIPTKYHYKLFFAPQFKNWVNSFKPGTFETPDPDEPRLIIPLIDRERNLIGIQGRSFKKKSLAKYITIKLDDNAPKLFGLDTVDPYKHVYVLEGPIDSMFIPNSIACTGSDLINQLPILSSDKSLFTVIHDNQPRNKEVVELYTKTIDAGYRVFIWPSNVESKDINELIVNEGFTPEQVVDMIDSNTHSGLEARLKLTLWSKV